MSVFLQVAYIRTLQNDTFMFVNVTPEDGPLGLNNNFVALTLERYLMKLIIRNRMNE
jgi:DNA/RNA endonuclease G (NUC1)